MPKKPTPSPTLRQFAIDRIHELAQDLRKSEKTLTHEAAVARVMQTPAGREAYKIYTTPGFGGPLFETLEHLAKGEAYVEQATMRDHIVSKRSGGPGAANVEQQASTVKLIGKADHQTLAAYLARHLANGGVTKEGGGSGSGPRGGRVEDPVTSGRRSPADTLPNLSDSIYAQLRAAAIAANPTLTAEKAVATYLTTSVGEVAHARWAAARQQEAQ